MLILGSEEKKSEVGTIVAGTIAYLACKNGDYVGALYNNERKISYFPFKLGMYNIEKILSSYEKMVESTKESYIEQTLKYIAEKIRRRMIIFIITDLAGLEKITDNTIKKLQVVNDIVFININDAYMTGQKAFDMEEGLYIPKMLLEDKKLHELEMENRNKIYENCVNRFKKYGINVETIDSEGEIIDKIIKLLNKNK